MKLFILLVLASLPSWADPSLPSTAAFTRENCLGCKVVTKDGVQKIQFGGGPYHATVEVLSDDKFYITQILSGDEARPFLASNHVFLSPKLLCDQFGAGDWSVEHVQKGTYPLQTSENIRGGTLKYYDTVYGVLCKRRFDAGRVYQQMVNGIPRFDIPKFQLGGSAKAAERAPAQAGKD